MSEALALGSARLQQVSDSPRLDAELLLSAALDVSRGSLFARGERVLSEHAAATYQGWLSRRENGEPVAYLLGTKGFWTLDLQVNADVLVPRPETETLVQWALELLPLPSSARVADLGTGSGAIALAIASERPRLRVLATDTSSAALKVARDNAQCCGIANVEFSEGNWYAAVQGRFDLIVSNPPYIAAGDAHLSALQHEPQSALTDGADGLSCLREIIGGAHAHLNDGAWLLLEHGYDQGAAVRALLMQAGFIGVQTRRDLGGQERISGGQWPASAP